MKIPSLHLHSSKPGNQKIGRVDKAFIFLGDRVGEIQKLIIDNIATITITPSAMILVTYLFNRNKDPKTKKRSMTEIYYQVLRQPLASALGITASLALILPFGKQVKSMAVMGKFPEHMNASFRMYTQSFELTDMLTKLDKLGSLSDNTVRKIKDLYKDSEQIRISAHQSVTLRAQLEKHVREISLPDMSHHNFEKDSLKVKFLKDYIAKLPQADLQIQELAQKAEASTIELEKKENDLTHSIRTLLKSDEINDKQKKFIIRKILRIHFTKSFEAFKQLSQFINDMSIFIIPATIANFMFPQFVKFAAPSLDKAVREQKSS